MSSLSEAEQIVDLQSRLSFQEDAIAEMSQQMAIQAEQLRVAERHIQLLNGKLNELIMTLDLGGTDGEQEKPPHY